jgi:hypothetical protein
MVCAPFPERAKHTGGGGPRKLYRRLAVRDEGVPGSSPRPDQTVFIALDRQKQMRGRRPACFSHRSASEVEGTLF